MIEQYYDQKVDYDKIGNGRRRGIEKLIGPIDGLIILDIGCGRGHLGAMLKKRGSVKVFGVDISNDAIGEAKQVLDGAYIANLESDAIPSEIMSQHFDFIVISEVLEHLFFPEKLLQKIKPIVDTNTKILITVPNLLFWKNRLQILLGNFDYTASGLMDRGHIHFFSWGSLSKMLESGGLKILDIAHNIPTGGTQFLGHLWPGLFAYQFILVAKYED